MDCILRKDLGPLWHELLYQTQRQNTFPASLMLTMKKVSMLAAMNYLVQQQALQQAQNIFQQEKIPFAVFKGVHTREIIYGQPANRPASDIDILIDPAHKERAIKALTQSGFLLQPLAQNISHEVTLTTSSTAIDLHWHILRPGRLRKDMTPDFLATRQEFPTHWGISNEATLFVMLVHPVFTKYSTTPHTALIQMVDCVRWIQSRPIDWEQVSTWLRTGGVQTAAWITGDYLRLLTGITMPASFISSIRPSRARAIYLRKWIEWNLSSRFLQHPLIIQAAYTLPAHDTAKDALRAIRTMIQEKKAASEKMKSLQRADTIS